MKAQCARVCDIQLILHGGKESFRFQHLEKKEKTYSYHLNFLL